MNFRTLGHFACIALLLSLSACTKPGSTIYCRPQIDQALRQASIPESNVKSMQMFAPDTYKQQRSNSALDAWVRLNSCRGHVVVTLTRSCYVQQVYTLGECSVPGLPKY